jgi:hypothetical protein
LLWKALGAVEAAVVSLPAVLAVLLTVFFPGELGFTLQHRENNLSRKFKIECFMRLSYASAFALFLLIVARVGFFAADAKSDVTDAPPHTCRTKLLMPTHEVASGPAGDREFSPGYTRTGANEPQT